MSDIYNPYAFGVLGGPAPLVAPPALRVVSGQATPEQIAMARDVFTRFCSGARLSHVPHPAEIGRLPDGSTYRITDVAGNRVMQLWAVGGVDEIVTRGGIVLLGLDGLTYHRVWYADGWKYEQMKAGNFALRGSSFLRADGKYVCTTTPDDHRTYKVMPDGSVAVEDGAASFRREARFFEHPVGVGAGMITDSGAFTYVAVDGQNYSVLSAPRLQGSVAPGDSPPTYVRGVPAHMQKAAVCAGTDRLYVSLFSGASPRDDLKPFAGLLAKNCSHAYKFNNEINSPADSGLVLKVGGDHPHQEGTDLRIPTKADVAGWRRSRMRAVDEYTPTVPVIMKTYVPPSNMEDYGHIVTGTPLTCEAVVGTYYNQTNRITEAVEAGLKYTQWCGDFSTIAGEVAEATLVTEADALQSLERADIIRDGRSMTGGISEGDAFAVFVGGVDGPVYLPIGRYDPSSLSPTLTSARWITRTLKDRLVLQQKMSFGSIEQTLTDIRFNMAVHVDDRDPFHVTADAECDVTIRGVVIYEPRAQIVVTREQEIRDFVLADAVRVPFAVEANIRFTRVVSVVVYCRGVEKRRWEVSSGGETLAYERGLVVGLPPSDSEHRKKHTYPVHAYGSVAGVIKTVNGVRHDPPDGETYFAPKTMFVGTAGNLVAVSSSVTGYTWNVVEDTTNDGGDVSGHFPEFSDGIVEEDVAVEVDPTSGGCCIRFRDEFILVSPDGAVSELPSLSTALTNLGHDMGET